MSGSNAALRAITLFCSLLPPLASQAGGVRPGDRVLLLSTRPIGCGTSETTLARKSYAAERVAGEWNRTGDATSLLASIDPVTPLVVYVHGNRISASDARSRGMHVYRRLTQCATDERPLQFLIFSWCSDKIPGQLRDYREKAARTRPVAAQLEWAIAQTPPGTPIGLLGYSYGARVVSGATHRLATRGEASHPLRAVFLAAAMDACWLAPGQRHGLALTRLDSLLVTKNPSDPAMRLYRFVEKKYDPQALGEAGPRGLDSSYSSLVRTRDVSASVGRSHDLYRYLAAPGLMRSAWKRLAFVDAGAVPTLANR